MRRNFCTCKNRFPLFCFPLSLKFFICLSNAQQRISHPIATMRRSQRRKDKVDDDEEGSEDGDDIKLKVKRSTGRSPTTQKSRVTRGNSWDRETLTQALNESKKEVLAFNVRVPMCLALTLKHTNTTRKLILSLTAMILSAYIEYIEVSERELHVAYLSSPFLVFLAFEFTVLSTAFVLLLPTTLTEADMEQQKTILDSRVISRLKLPGFAARWAAGVRVALVQLTRALIQDSAVFLALFLLFTGVSVGSEHVKLDAYSSIEDMDDGSGISVTNIERER